MKIGVLAVQGAFREHLKMLSELGVEAVPVKRKEQLEGLDGLIIPGGESTSIGKLMREYDLINPIKTMADEGMPVMGTCAGMIVMAGRIAGGEEPHLGIMDVEVNRNSFGRQKDSFETELQIPALGGETFPAVFIRAPHIVEVGNDVDVISKYEDRMVGVKQGNLLAFSFHPELTGDRRIHQYFLDLVKQHKNEVSGATAKA